MVGAGTAGAEGVAETAETAGATVTKLDPPARRSTGPLSGPHKSESPPPQLGSTVATNPRPPMPFRVTKQEQKILVVLAVLLVLGALGMWLI